LPQSDSQGSSTGMPPVVLPLDAGEEDALPPIDVAHAPDVVSNFCPDAGATLVYVITEQYDLMSFYPPTETFKTIGRIQCPAGPSVDGTPATPFSMAVDRDGIAYVVYNTGELFRVSTATAACRSTGFVAGQQGFSEGFGMGYSRDSNGPGETLYIASDDPRNPDGGSSGPPRLGTIDTPSFRLRVVGFFRPALYGAELTGTGAGDLFAFYSLTADGGSLMAIGQVDKTTGQLVGQSVLPGIDRGCGWAFAFWGGDFYTFTAPGTCDRSGSPPGTVVHRFSPGDGRIVKVTQIGEEIVGAGVSTCAPQQ
jgi:hypothetical protein